jgi:biotin carboxylase
MAERVRDAGLALPPFAPAPDADAVRDFGRRHGWPVVVKPRVGSSSAYVSKVDGPADCDRLTGEGGPLLVQAYDRRPIHHVDGYFDGAVLSPFRVSRYLNTCLGFRAGAVLGSVECDDQALVAAVGAFGRDVLAALTTGPTMVHLEVFADPATGECAFLEVGARVGGAEIPFLWREVHAYDLMEAAFRLGLGLPPRPWPAPGPEVAGWLLVPAPAARPCRITEATPMTGRRPGPYAEALLRPGEILPAAEAYYEHVGGRFRFRGGSSAEVTAAIEATARDFRVDAEPLGQPTASCCR